MLEVPSLIQDEIRSKFDDEYAYEWAHNVAVIVLNKTTNRRARIILPAIWEIADNPRDMAAADVSKLKQALEILGYQATISSSIKLMSQQYLEGKRRKELHGLGNFAEESSRIFLDGDIEFEPKNKDLWHYAIARCIKENKPLPEKLDRFEGKEGKHPFAWDVLYKE